ncbi:HAMP domain-containing sensor histidine kinase [Clostridium ganghwense]|uniref:histidine kinase n=1 Tax=Clostridium ganghwense TaxID=312089 RepID=A0ABT4CJS0_9CLOT|nr:HAMP domain-containing sensor histidine kinase [Clostridium ganghwense]MCY6369293.1 HAMP domain-containing sensor histidine kinase [Clostridium ganghwense]
MQIGIKKKIMIMNIVVLIPAILLIGLVTMNSLYDKVIHSSINMLKQESYNGQAYVMNYLKRGENSNEEMVLENMSQFIATYLSNYSKLRVQIYNNDGLIGDSKEYPYFNKDKDVESAVSGTKGYIIKKVQGKRYVFFSSPIYFNNKTLGCIRYIYSIDNELKIVWNTVGIMGLVSTLAIIISIFLSNIFANKIVSPVLKLKNASEQVANGEFSKVIEVDSEDEISQLASSFNTMSQNVSKYIFKLKDEKQKQKIFLDNITHEFKTPLTSIMGYSDLITKVRKTEDLDKCSYYIKKEGKRLLLLVEELLEVSRLSRNEFKINKQKTNIKKIIEESLSTLQLRLDKYNIKVHKKIYDNELFIDGNKTEQVMLNIIDNAIKYAECNNIFINMNSEKDKLLISIKDDGKGIPLKDLEKVFQPFFTVNRKLQKQLGGVGLGLHICKEIMRKQDGDILIKVKDGTEIVLVFKMLQL